MTDVKENFCGICAAVPLALAGFGGTAYAASGSEKKQRNTIILIGCSIILIVSIFMYLKYSTCNKCLAG
jgi:hypothetical protein